MEAIRIIKFGGAAITDKNREFTARNEVISRVFSELASSPPMKTIVIHGAGSFAHSLAREYDLANGYSEKISRPDQILGISKIKKSLHYLHELILSAANNAGLHAFSLPISAMLITNGQNDISSVFLDPIDHTLKNDLIPIMFGDMVFDEESGFIVVSGDRIIKLLCKKFAASKIPVDVIFGSDVDGLYDKDPKEDGAKLIESLDLDSIHKALTAAGGSAGVDITGGMLGKLKQIEEILEFGFDVRLVNIKKKDRLGKLLSGQEVVHSHFSVDTK